MKRTSAKSYDWNVLCMICREKIKASTAVRRWDGLIVGKDHPGCFEYRSPLDWPAPPLRDQRPLPYTSPEPADIFTPIGISSTITVTASPFNYTISNSPEQITFGGTGTISRLQNNGQDIPAPFWKSGQTTTIQFGPGTKLIVTYSGTITMQKFVISSYSDATP